LRKGKEPEKRHDFKEGERGGSEREEVNTQKTHLTEMERESKGGDPECRKIREGREKKNDLKAALGALRALIL